MQNQIFFKDRIEAGKRIGEMLRKMSYLDPVILGLPHGGLVVAHEVARVMEAPLDVIISRKVLHPKNPDMVIGGISEDEIPLFSPESVKHVSHTSEQVLEGVSHERTEMRRRLSHFRPARHLFPVKKKTVIVVDDGIASGATAAAAGKYLRGLGPDKLILAIPVGPVEISSFVRDQFDDVFCLEHVKEFKAVANHYESFESITDREVMKMLEDYYPREKFL